VLLPEAAPVIQVALQVDQPLEGAGPLTVQVNKERVLISAGPAQAPTLAVTLVNPAAAPPSAPRAAGVALLTVPGPAPSGAVRALLQRLRASPRPVPWAIPKSSGPESSGPASVKGAPHDQDPSSPGGEEDSRPRDPLPRIDHLLDTGQTAAARAMLEGLPPMTGPSVDPEVQVARALRWRRLGDTERVNTALAHLTQLPPALAALAAVARNDDAAVDARVTAADVDTACALTAVPRAYRFLKRPDRALTVSQALRARAGECAAVWNECIHSAVDARAADAVGVLVDEALRRFPEEDSVRSAAAAAYLYLDRLPEAVALETKLARVHVGERSALQQLLAVLLRDVAHRETYRARFTEAFDEDPSDPVARFVLGVLAHYENDFERSQELLRPLEPVLKQEDRLQIYLAMNDFNLGHRQAALRRLERAVKAHPDPDPDVYYCISEVVRDQDPRRAREMLGRYAALSQHNPLSNPVKEKRIRALFAGLEQCISTGERPCPGPWEHPRLRNRVNVLEWIQSAAGWLWPAMGGVGLALLLLGGWAVRRRR